MNDIRGYFVNFNSIKVRLELDAKTGMGEVELNFNSIKVRLEQAVMMLTYGSLLFQFHKGAIRTRKQTICGKDTEISIP